ncbi:MULTISPECIES: mandelate racemase/muconate lactonizing enzyme family protein [Chromohalobacter]|uniref:Mandelate racemase/muconate lactonizing enzyme n=1 Tax=Chromohalobacter israelensis (strain ATCC BAA-138 / DSM 3043 / CIP 106854 / NCIMB 13768 / 1H11) TaxID=290398 RepID=Q1QUN5_CHRI1|nr:MULTISPECIES: mandelate racemase/muconate lactonizing enzyme family protein [Chromohalobacter]ABE59823.1 mandelate racemase/muconate lactonizing enzyme [Chromohalobacter salexigens DSM 3043]MDO0947213.1 mandelate racemase/muconate lactonizing enzyme family protein [Chromohalobacter salexigens]NQY46559.1 mandelate racemase/muconate lactonizing enzyme family protein [Chromohalobacter sp.]NWO57517.1 mandelate racemase/muconate lactonizing enzyme family protein [Chromohalobacter salexigens]PWW3
MKIEKIHAHVLDYQLEQAFESASMRFDRRQHCLVEVICDDGTIGWGECLGPAKPNAAVIEAYATSIIGRNPLETEKLWIELYNRLRDQGQRGLTVTALSGIDIALWDIKGKHYGAPVSELLGGRFREHVHAYATGSFKRDGVDRVQDTAEEVAGYAQEGFCGVKIKIGFDVEEDVKVIAAAREALGNGKRLMIDANHGYDLLEALEVGKRAAAFDVAWFEEPVLPEQISTYHAVRDGQPLPVASGENWHGRYAMLEPLQTRAVDIVQPDVCSVGGISEMRRVVDMAAMFGVRLIPHVWGTAVCLAASLQCMAALPPNPPRRRPIEPIMEFDRTHNPFRQAVVKTPLEHDGGVVQIPDGPGLGIEINRDALRQFALKEA